MSEQAKVLAEMQALIVGILQSGSTTVEEADRMDELEELLYKQNSFKKINHSRYSHQSELIASLFFSDNYTEAIEKLCECKITPDDFFGFVEYYYDDEHEDEALTEMFTATFIATVNQEYHLKCQSQ